MKTVGKVAVILIVSLLVVGAISTAVNSIGSSGYAGALASGSDDDDFGSESSEHEQDDDDDDDREENEREGGEDDDRFDDDRRGGFGFLGIGKNLITILALVAVIVLAIRFWKPLQQRFAKTEEKETG